MRSICNFFFTLWHVRDVFFLALGHANLRVPAETTDKDELGHVGRTRRGGREGLLCILGSVRVKVDWENTHASDKGLTEEGEHDERVCHGV